MKITPQKIHISPKYPTKMIIEDQPELLCRAPERWKGNPTVMAALAGVGMLVAGCKLNAADQANPAAKVAPVFIHGIGSGAYGCMVVNPPVFLSEEEARDVIEQEAKKAGIKFTKGITLDDILMPPPPVPKPPKTDPDFTFHDSSSGTYGSKPSPVELDGSDSKRNISFEFVSRDDCGKWEWREASTVQEYNPKNTADVLKSQLSKTQSKGTYAVFYEPFTYPVNPDYDKVKDWDAARKNIRNTAREVDKAELRKQVQDFIKWLKAEGII